MITSINICFCLLRNQEKCNLWTENDAENTNDMFLWESVGFHYLNSSNLTCRFWFSSLALYLPTWGNFLLLLWLHKIVRVYRLLKAQILKETFILILSSFYNKWQTAFGQAKSYLKVCFITSASCLCAQRFGWPFQITVQPSFAGSTNGLML